MCNGELADEFEVEKIIGKRFDANNKVEYLVMWKGYGLREATWEPRKNMHCPKLVRAYEAQWRREQQAAEAKLQSKLMATLDRTKVAQAQRVDDWYKRVMHSITTTYILNGHKNDDDDEGDVGKDTCGRSMMDWCVWNAERDGVVGDWQCAEWMDGGPTAQLSVWW